MKKMFLAALAATMFATGANAALLSIDDTTHGVGAITRDTATNLDWLDLSKTFNWTYSGASSQFGVGGQFAGFRGASGSEVQEFMSNAGLPISADTTTVSSDPADLAAADALTALIGETVGAAFGSSYHGGRGLVFDESAYNDIRMVGYYTINGSVLFNDYFEYGDHSYSGSGVWLVRAAPNEVPEPAMLGLFGLGLIGLAARRRRTAA